jgi:hypothetical protein
MQIPITNRTGKEILLGLEPEGDTISLAQGQTVVVKAVGSGSDAPRLEVEIANGLLSISMMCGKEVWCENIRLR